MNNRPPIYHEIEVWVPHRISGFFQIEDSKERREVNDFDHIGSRGGGPALNAFGKTKVRFIKTLPPALKNNCYHIFLDGEDKSAETVTSLSVLKQMEKFFDTGVELEINHNFDLPRGCGYGSSGAGAFGLALCINTMFNLGFSIFACAKIAHIAEAMNHTGLGTIGGQICGGWAISMEPGYPFNLDWIAVPPNIKIVTASWGPLSTSAILTHPEYKRRIIESGQIAMKELRTHFDLQNFMIQCREFIKRTDLMRNLKLEQLEKVIEELNHMEILGASMNQLGNSLFAVCPQEMTSDVVKVIKKFKPTHTLQIVDVCTHGPIIKNIC